MDQVTESVDTVRSARVADSGEYVARSHECPDCGDRSRLVVRWNGKAEEVICHRCGRKEGFRRRKSITQLWKESPESIPIPIANRLEQKHGGVSPMTSTELALANEQTLMKRMAGARWLANVSEQDKRALAQLAIAYGLDPVMGELVIYEGKPYITFAGMVRKAHDTKGFEGVEDRPMTDDERAAYGIKQPIGWIAKVYRRGFRVPTVGTGAADPDRPFRNNPIEKERPQWMARTRAIRQALRLAFPHSLPFGALEAAEERGIDPETGEILQARATAVSADEIGEAADDDEQGFDAPAHSTGDLRPGDLTASPIPEAHDEQGAIEDARAKVATLMGDKRTKQEQIDRWCQKHLGCNYADATLDGLNALIEALAAIKAKSTAG